MLGWLLKRKERYKPVSATESKASTEVVKDFKLHVLIPSELPVYKYEHPFGSIAVYCTTNVPLSPEKILLLLEQAKFDLLIKKPA